MQHFSHLGMLCRRMGGFHLAIITRLQISLILCALFSLCCVDKFSRLILRLKSNGIILHPLVEGHWKICFAGFPTKPCCWKTGRGILGVQFFKVTPVRKIMMSSLSQDFSLLHLPIYRNLLNGEISYMRAQRHPDLVCNWINCIKWRNYHKTS